jgi:predicted nucleic acid-binding protein
VSDPTSQSIPSTVATGSALTPAAVAAVLARFEERPPARYLIDNSVWARMHLPVVAARVAAIQADHIIAVATPQALEFGYSARNAAELDQAHAAMGSFETLAMSEQTHVLALRVQRALWNDGLIRAAGVFDVLIAAIALEHGAVVLHYDADYGRIAAVIPEFRQELVAPLGSL